MATYRLIYPISLNDFFVNMPLNPCDFPVGQRLRGLPFWNRSFLKNSHYILEIDRMMRSYTK